MVVEELPRNSLLHSWDELLLGKIGGAMGGYLVQELSLLLLLLLLLLVAVLVAGYFAPDTEVQQARCGSLKMEARPCFCLTSPRTRSDSLALVRLVEARDLDAEYRSWGRKRAGRAEAATKLRWPSLVDWRLAQSWTLDGVHRQLSGLELELTLVHLVGSPWVVAVGPGFGLVWLLPL